MTELYVAKLFGYYPERLQPWHVISSSSYIPSKYCIVHFEHHQQCLNCVNYMDTDVEYAVQKKVFQGSNIVHKTNTIKGTHLSCNGQWYPI